MTNPFILVARWVLSPGERAALRLFLAERAIASNHRQGLKKTKRHALYRPARINLGCGFRKKEGFLNIDLYPPADITLDLRRALPFAGNCCELIFAEHCLEHFEYPQTTLELLRECFRILKPRGMLLLSVPDTEWPLNDYRDGPSAKYFEACIQHAWSPKYCTTRLEHINYHFRQGTEHQFAYDFETLAKILTVAGFRDVQPRPYDSTLDSEHRRAGSLFVSCSKPAESAMSRSAEVPATTLGRICDEF